MLCLDVFVYPLHIIIYAMVTGHHLLLPLRSRSSPSWFDQPRSPEIRQWPWQIFPSAWDHSLWISIIATQKTIEQLDNVGHLETMGNRLFFFPTWKYCDTPFWGPTVAVSMTMSLLLFPLNGRTWRPNNWMLMIVSIGTLDTTVLDKPCFKDPIYMSATHVVPDDLWSVLFSIQVTVSELQFWDIGGVN